MKNILFIGNDARTKALLEGLGHSIVHIEDEVVTFNDLPTYNIDAVYVSPGVSLGDWYLKLVDFLPDETKIY